MLSGFMSLPICSVVLEARNASVTCWIRMAITCSSFPITKRISSRTMCLKKAYHEIGGMEVSSMKLCRLIASQHNCDFGSTDRIPRVIEGKRKPAPFDLTKAERLPKKTA